MEAGGKATRLWSRAWPVVAFAITLSIFYAVGYEILAGFALDVGSITLPRPRFALFLFFSSLLIALAAIFLTLALVRVMDAPFARRSLEAASGGADRWWILCGAIAALLIPWAIRTFVLEGAPLTDDESAYRFMAELLASGRVRMPSPPLKLFFDNAFMINDGHMYAQYFLGWPALIVPGVFFDATGYVNAFYSALTVPAIFLVIRRLTDSTHAKLGLVLYLSSPMLMIGAATEMSHTSCTMALVWATWAFLRTRNSDSPAWAHAGLALGFCAAFFIRPLTASGLGLPILIAWLFGLRSLDRPHRVQALLSFGLPVLVLASLFLLVNQIQNGSVFAVSYQQYLEYSIENESRFSALHPSITETVGFQFSGISRGLALAGVALIRLNSGVFGWPLLFSIFLPLALVSRSARLVWLSLLSFFAVNLFIYDVGIDSFGPVHYFESAWPFLLLTVLGLHVFQNLVSSLSPQQSEYLSMRGLTAHSIAALPRCALLALIVTSLVSYVPVRLSLLQRLSANINAPRELLASSDIHNAIIFAPRPFLFQKSLWPANHFVYFRPNSDPDLQDDILWVNHLSIEQDKKLMELFPERDGYVMVNLQDSSIRFLQLSGLQPGAVPDYMRLRR